MWIINIAGKNKRENRGAEKWLLLSAALVLPLAAFAARSVGMRHSILDQRRYSNRGGLALVSGDRDIAGKALDYRSHRLRLRGMLSPDEQELQLLANYLIHADSNRSGQLNEDELKLFIFNLTGEYRIDAPDTGKLPVAFLQAGGGSHRELVLLLCALMRFYNISCYVAQYEAGAGEQWLDAAFRVETANRGGDYLLISESGDLNRNTFLRSTRLVYGEAASGGMKLSRVRLPEQVFNL